MEIIPDGLSRHVSSSGEGIWLFRQGTGITAYPDVCRHQRGQFQACEDAFGNTTCLRCPQHGWLLDATTGNYQNPSGGLKQATFPFRVTGDGRLQVYALPLDEPWKLEAHPWDAATGDIISMSLTYYSHACIRVKMDQFVCFTDPWLSGPAFTRGWWLLHEPPETWLSDLASADAIIISHSHSDHLHLPTLKRVAAVNANVPIWLPAYNSSTCERLVKQAGMENVHCFPFFEWLPCGNSSGRLMLLPDESGREDSGMLFDYQGRRILNTVDCPNLNGGHLPSPVDVLLTGFAGGASGYPVCWQEQYGEAEIARQVAKNRQLLLQSAAQLIKKTTPAVVIPFAGYFTEAHPADAYIQQINIKNDPQDFADVVAKRFPGVDTWIPQPGDTLQLQQTGELPLTRFISEASMLRLTKAASPSRGEAFIMKIDAQLSGAMAFQPLQQLSGWQHYFSWVAYQGPLVLHVLETDLDFDHVLNEFWVDFTCGGAVSRTAIQYNPATVSYQRMRIRADAFRHVCRWGLSWEEFSIGFQARFYREPDVYQFEFWNHVQNHLPAELPWDAGKQGVITNGG